MIAKMFFLIAAVPIVRTRDTGRFHCQRCRASDVPFTYKTQQVWLSLFFLPVLPVSFKQHYIECDKCFAVFSPDVMDAQSPSREDYFLSDCRDGLSRGWALESIQEDIVKAGYTVEFARGWLETTVGGSVCVCEPCGLHYIKGATRCLKCGRNLNSI